MPGLGGGIPAIGALPALPSPTAGMGGADPFAQLLTAAATVPGKINQAKTDKLKRQELEQNIASAKRTNAEQTFKQLQAVAKAQPAVLNTPAFKTQFDTTAKALGIDPSVYYNAPGVTPNGGAAPGPQPMQTPGQSNVAAPTASGAAPGGQGAPGSQEPGAPSINAAALNPRTDFDTLAAQPSWVKEAMTLSPRARRATYGNVPGVTDQFLDADPVLDPMTKRYILQGMQQNLVEFGKGNVTPESFRGYIKANFNNLSDAGVQPSELLTPDVTAHMGQMAQAKIENMRRAGILSEAQARAKLQKTQADIQMLGVRESYMQAQTGLVQKKAQWIDADEQSKIQQRYASADHAAQNISIRQQELTLAQDRGSLAQYNAKRAALASDAGNLRGQIGQLQATGRALISAGNDTTVNPATGKTYGDEITEKINQIQPLLDQASDALHKASGAGGQAVLHRTLQTNVGMPGGKTVTAVDGNAPAARTGKQANAPGKPPLFEYSDGSWRPN